MTEHTQPFWQKHLLLIVGIALPFALMIFVFLYQKIVTASVPDPQYVAVYADLDNNGYYAGTFDTDVVNGQLEVIYIPPKGNSDNFDISKAKLRIFVAKPGIKDPPAYYDLRPTSDMTKDRSLLTLPDALKVKMIDGDEAPDGYRYRGYTYSDRGLLNGILIGSSSRYDRELMVERDGRTVPLPVVGRDTSYYYNLRFIGWVAQ